MNISLRKNKYLPIANSILLVWSAYKIGEAIGGGAGSHRVIFIFGSIAAAGSALYFVSKLGDFPLFCILLFLFWVPFETRLHRIFLFLWGVHLFEMGIWCLFLVVLLNNTVFLEHGGKRLQFFAVLPWMLFLFGALASNFLSGPFSVKALTYVRMAVILPFLTTFLCFYYIRSVRQAELMLWMFMISGAILGIIFLCVPIYVQDVTHSGIQNMLYDNLAIGRLTKIIDLPLLSPLHFNAETGGISFVFIGTLALVFWLNAPILRKKVLAGIILAVSCYVIIQSQGRSALIGLTASFGTVLFLCLKFEKKFSRHFIGIGLKVGVVLFCVFSGLVYKLSTISYSIARLRYFPLLYDPLSVHGVQERINRLINAAEVYLQNPVFGVGLYGFPLNLTGASWYAHNLYLYLLLSFGLIGFIGFLLVLIYHTKALWGGIHSGAQMIFGIAGTGCVVGLLASGMTSSVFASIWNVLAFWIPIGVTVAACFLPEEKTY